MLKEWIDIIQSFFAKSRNVLQKDINGKTIKHIWGSYAIFAVITLLIVWSIPKGFPNAFFGLCYKYSLYICRFLYHCFGLCGRQAETDKITNAGRRKYKTCKRTVKSESKNQYIARV